MVSAIAERYRQAKLMDVRVALARLAKSPSAAAPPGAQRAIGRSHAARTTSGIAPSPSPMGRAAPLRSPP
jgi:hypothetical protein